MKNVKQKNNFTINVVHYYEYCLSIIILLIGIVIAIDKKYFTALSVIMLGIYLFPLIKGKIKLIPKINRIVVTVLLIFCVCIGIYFRI